MKLTSVLLSMFLLGSVVSSRAQTCNPNIPASAPDSRFVFNTSGTVFDTATNLTWKRCSEGQTWNGTICAGDPGRYSWPQALQLAEAASFAGQVDWRLPDSKELASLVEQSCVDPAINITIFPNIPNTPSRRFWSGSPSGRSSDDAWIVNFHNGEVYEYDSMRSIIRVRLVRGGQ